MKSAFTIRPLTPQDEPFLWEMLYQAIYVPEGQPRPPRSILQEPSLAHYARAWGQQPGDLGILALEPAQGQPVGAAWLRLFSGADPGYGYVAEDIPEFSVAILPEYRGQGLGSLLLETLLKEAAGSYRSVSLSVSRDNPVTRLYARLGFVTCAESDSSLTMVRRL